MTVEKILRSRGGCSCGSNFFVEVIIFLGLEERRERERCDSLYSLVLIFTREQSTLNHQSHMKYCWLKIVPVQKKK